MMFGALIVTSLIGLYAWGCLALILGRYGVYLPLWDTLFAWSVYQAGPVLLLIIAWHGWAKLRQWRRMEEMRARPDGGVSAYLARGTHRVSIPKERISLPERLASSMMIFALATVPFWQGTENPWLWVGFGALTLLSVRALLLIGTR